MAIDNKTGLHGQHNGLNRTYFHYGLIYAPFHEEMHIFLA